MRKGAVGGLALLAGAFALAGAFGFTLYAARPIAIDAKTHCPIAGPSGDLTLILVDASSAPPASAAANLRALVSRFLGEQDSFAEIRIAALAGSGEDGKGALTPVLTLCAPERPDRANPLVRNRDQLRAQWRDDFERPALRALARAESRDESTDSPILEALAAFAAQTGLAERKGRRRVIVTTDLIERGPQWRLDLDPALWPDAKAIAARFARDQDWAGVAVEILTPPPTQAALAARQSRRQDWWRAFFTTLGAEANFAPL